MSRETLRPEHLKARLIRALSGLTQDQMGEETGLAPSLIDQFEQGKVLPGEDHLEEMARCAGFEAADADELLVHFRTQSQTWLRPSESVGSILDHLVRRLRRHSVHAVQRLLKLSPPEPGDRGHAGQQLAKLKRLSYRSRLAVVRSVEEYQSQALAERCREESRRQAAVNSKRSTAWARLAAEIARVRL
jgi:transcriptional regulator with XRE-family HTH domain